MRKIFYILAIGLYLTGITACNSNEKNALPVFEQVELEILEEIPEETEIKNQMPINPIAERAELLYSENNYIHDENAVLSETEFEFYNNYLSNLHDSQGINAIVVITNHLDNNSPADFAKSYYQALFPEESDGFLLLINNDSYQDKYYLSGSCSQTVSQEEIYILIAKATPCLVEKRYGDALEILLSIIDSDN